MNAKIRIGTKAVAWDFDGTLIDSFGLFEDIVQQVFGNRGWQLPAREVLEKNYHGRLEDTLKSIMVDPDDSQIEEVAREFLALQEPMYEKLDGHFFSDALDLVLRIHAAGIFQLIVSNRAHDGRGNASPRSIITKPPLKGIIDIAVCGDDNDFNKPDGRVLDEVIAKFGLTPGDFTVIGDQYVDAQLALNLGGKGIIVSRDKEELVHADKLHPEWKDHVSLVRNLHDIVV